MIDLTYPHNWVNLDKPIYFAILTDPTQNISEMLVDNFEIRESQDLYRSIISPQGFARMWVRRMARISAGNFTAQVISDLILLMLKDFVKDIKQPEIDFLESTQIVRFRQKSKYAIATFTDNSVLHILGLDKQTTRVNLPEKPGVEYMVFDASETVLLEQAPQLKRATSMFVYSDILELSLVGDTQAASLGFLPIQSKFGD